MLLSVMSPTMNLKEMISMEMGIFSQKVNNMKIVEMTQPTAIWSRNRKLDIFLKIVNQTIQKALMTITTTMMATIVAATTRITTLTKWREKEAKEKKKQDCVMLDRCALGQHIRPPLQITCTV